MSQNSAQNLIFLAYERNIALTYHQLELLVEEAVRLLANNSLSLKMKTMKTLNDNNAFSVHCSS